MTRPATEEELRERQEDLAAAKKLLKRPSWWLHVAFSETVLVPWPLRILGPIGDKRKDPRHWGNLALSAAAALTACMYATVPAEGKSWVLLTDVARDVLVNGTSLMFALLVLWAAMPNGGLVQGILSRTPSFAIREVRPYLWAVVAGGVGIVASTWANARHDAELAGGLLWDLEPVARFLTWLGVLSLIQAVMHAIQSYALDLLMVSSEQLKTDIEKFNAEAEAAQNAATPPASSLNAADDASQRSRPS